MLLDCGDGFRVGWSAILGVGVRGDFLVDLCDRPLVVEEDVA